jgi:hypothetical protein
MAEVIVGHAEIALCVLNRQVLVLQPLLWGSLLPPVPLSMKQVRCSLP